MRPLRICMVHSYYSGDTPSGENVAVDVQAEALRRAGHDVRIVSVSTDGVRKRQRAYELRSAMRVATKRGTTPVERIRAARPDVVHVHNLFPNWTDGWLGQIGAPTVATLHNYRSLCAAGTFHRSGKTCTLCPEVGSWNAVRYACYRDSPLATVPLALATSRMSRKRGTLAKAEALIALSDRAREMIQHFAQIPDARIHVIPNFSPRLEIAGQTLADPAWADSWLFAGRLTTEKGVAELVRSWPRTERLIIAGEGPLLSNLRSSATPNIEVIGSVPHLQLAAMLGAVKGLIFPSLWPEAAPMIYVEALAAGCPVIALAGNSVADQVSEHSTGAVVQSLRDLPSAMAHVGASPRLRKRCREVHELHFSENSWVQSITQVYASTLSLD